MRRWRKDVTRCHTGVKINYTDWVATPEAQRSAKMQKNFDDIKELANDSDDKCMVVMNWLHNLKEEICKHMMELVKELSQVHSRPLLEVKTAHHLKGDNLRLSKLLKRDNEREKKTKYRQDNTDGGTEIPAQSDVFCHTNAPPICESDNLVGTQESNNAVMDNMALLLGLAHSWWSFKSVVQTTIDMER
ncbi:unnamed protein product [Prunus armeniaca]